MKKNTRVQAFNALSAAVLIFSVHGAQAGLTTSMTTDELTQKNIPPSSQHKCAFVGSAIERIAPEKVLPTLKTQTEALPVSQKFAIISALCSGPTGLTYYTCAKAASGKARCSVSSNIAAPKGFSG